MPNTLEVARGITMPFFPMRPQRGRPLRTPAQVKGLLEELDGDRWLIQPKLGGIRACLAVVDKKVWVQNRHGNWLMKPLRDGQDFLRLPDRTCLDGEIVEEEFHPFECLAVKGQSLIFHPTTERATVAFQLVKLIGHTWLFSRPSPKFLKAQRHNLPLCEGVVMKDLMAFYTIMAKRTQTSPAWLKRLWR